MAENNPKPLDLDASENEQIEPTEREEHFFKAMIDAADGSTPEELEPTERREHWYSGIINAIQNGSGGGSGGGVLVVHSIDDYTTLDKTWQEIHDAALNGVVVLIDEVDAQNAPLYLYEVTISGDEYQVAFGDSYYIASSASGYPVYSDPNSEA